MGLRRLRSGHDRRCPRCPNPRRCTRKSTAPFWAFKAGVKTIPCVWLSTTSIPATELAEFQQSMSQLKGRICSIITDFPGCRSITEHRGLDILAVGYANSVYVTMSNVLYCHLCAHAQNLTNEECFNSKEKSFVATFS